MERQNKFSEVIARLSIWLSIIRFEVGVTKDRQDQDDDNNMLCNGYDIYDCGSHND